jgi:uncharacterized protein
MPRHFVFDPQKSATNQHKHGIDFKLAQRLWDGPTLEFPIPPPKGRREMRYLVLGKIDEKPFSAIVTYHGWVTRIISVRGSNEIERQLYANEIKKIEKTH